MQETQVQSLGWEDPLEKEMATHSSVLAWKISWTEETGGLWSRGFNPWITCIKCTSPFLVCFYWSLVEIPCCANFCCTEKWLSYVYYTFFSHVLFHFGLSQDIDKPTVVYSRTLLFIHSIYTSLHLLISNSQFNLLPPLSTLAATLLFFMSMILFLFHR